MEETTEQIADRRQVVVSRDYLRFWVMVPFLIVAITLGGVWFDIERNREARRHATAISDLRLCTEIEKLKEQIRTSVIRSDKLLPTLAYYKDHPADLAIAHRENKHFLKVFARSDCHALPTVPKGTKGAKGASGQAVVAK